MIIWNVTEELVNSKYFKDCARQRNKEGARLRMFRLRFKRSLLTTGSCVEMLEYFKYEIEYKIIRKPELVYHDACDNKNFSELS